MTVENPRDIARGAMLTNALDSTTLARHRWYPIKEGFSAKLVADTLAAAAPEPKKKIFVIEPFSGSGTTPVECTRLGADCLAFEVNPFLAFVGQTKLRQLDPKVLTRERTKVLHGLDRPVASPLEGKSTFCEGPRREKWLFNRPVLRSFTGGWNAVSECSPAARAFLRLALVRATMDNCNAYPDGKCLRYKRLKDYSMFNAESLQTSFEGYCRMIEEDLVSTPFKDHSSRVECGDSRKLRSHTSRRKFDFCVTSPPYLNSFDYSDVYRPELFLAGMVSSTQDLMKIRLRTLRSHVQVKWEAPSNQEFGAVYTKVWKELESRKENLWNPRLLLMVQAYFEDMERLLLALHGRANPGAELKIAVATSAYAGVVIPVDLILGDIAETVGWQLKEIDVVRRLRSSGQLWHHDANSNEVPALRESLVVLRMPKAPKGR